MNKKYIEEKAGSILKQIGCEDRRPDVFDIAESLGFTIGNALLVNQDEGFLLIDDTKKRIWQVTGVFTDRIIGVRVNLDLQEKLFVIACELGHYVLHCQNGGAFYAHRRNKKNSKKMPYALQKALKCESSKDEDAYEDAYFARCLLMPRERFKKEYDDFKDKGLSENVIITLLCEHFSVSGENAKIRIKEVT